MFFGKHEHTIDEKNRLTLPAKFRDALSDGVVLARGIDGTSTSIHGRAGTSSVAADRRARLAHAGGARDEALLLRRRGRRRARQAGPRPRSAGPRAHAGLGKDVVVAGVHDHLEIWDRAAWAVHVSAIEGSAAMLPNVQRTDAADHVPVLADEVRELLAVQPGETVVDATFGAGGHSRLLAADLQGSGKLVAIDRDPTVRPYFDRVKARRAACRRASSAATSPSCSRSSPGTTSARTPSCSTSASRSMQVDRPERGFSYATDAPLDMRMDPSDELSAADVNATWDERELETIFRRYGEERYARQIARAIVRRRSESRSSAPGSSSTSSRRRFRRRPASARGIPRSASSRRCGSRSTTSSSRSRPVFPAAFEMLRPGGRLAVISFHSLEDRIVKRFLRDRARGCTCPPELPGLRLRAGAGAADPDAEARATVGARGRPQSARELGAPAGGGQGLMSTIAQPAHERGRVRTRAAARRRPLGPSGGGVALDRRSSRCCSPASSPSTSPCSA